MFLWKTGTVPARCWPLWIPFGNWGCMLPSRKHLAPGSLNRAWSAQLYALKTPRNFKIEKDYYFSSFTIPEQLLLIHCLFLMLAGDFGPDPTLLESNWGFITDFSGSRIRACTSCWGPCCLIWNGLVSVSVHIAISVIYHYKYTIIPPPAKTKIWASTWETEENQCML